LLKSSLKLGIKNWIFLGLDQPQKLDIFWDLTNPKKLDFFLGLDQPQKNL